MGLRFDPESDLEVSTHHARFERRSDGWWICDLGSRNGTWVDGQRIDEHPARPGQRIRFGWEGPEIEVMPTDQVPLPGQPLHAQHLQMLARRNRALAGLLGIVLLASGGALWLNSRSRAAARAEWDQERAALQARADSLLQASRGAEARLEGEIEGLAEALEASTMRVRALQADLDALDGEARSDPAELVALRQRLDEAMAALTHQQVAASLDVATLTGRVRPAVVMVYVEFTDGRRSVATGFAVADDGSIVTNRHVVAGANGFDRTARIGIQFSGSPQVWPADLVRTDPVADLALVRARRMVGGNPVIPSINTRSDSLAVGSPVLLLGFPNATPAVDGGPVPRALATAGVLSARGAGRLEVQGWGAEGASGSPLLDSTGQVVGVLYGAVGSADARHLVAVPASSLLAFLGR